MNKSVTALLFIAIGGLLTACVSTEPRDADRSRGMNQPSPVRAAEINTQLGIGYLERGQLEIAMDKLQIALRNDPDHVPAHLTLAMIYDRLGDEGNAERHYRAADRLAPEDGGTQNAYGAFLCHNRDFERAERHFMAATRDPFYRTPEVAWANAGACARRSGQPERAIELLRRALDINSGNPDALYNLAELYYEQGDAFRARAFLQRLEAAGANEASALYLGYRIESSLGNRDQAGAYASRLARDFPDSREAEQMRSLQRNDS